MKTSLEHLPQQKQRELQRVIEIIHEEFEQAHLLATSSLRKKGRILKIILFGSYARGGWVDEPHTASGYQSDYDLLIIVSQKKLTDVEYWYPADDRFIRDSTIKPLVNFIVHSLEEVNSALSEGQYFFSDIKTDGVLLYDLPGHHLVDYKPLDPVDAHKIAKRHFEQWFKSATEFHDDFARNIELGRNNKAAFYLHQATENLYTAILMVLTNYRPNSHNLKFLRALTEGLDQRLADAWPRVRRRDRATFELLREAYVKARYSEHYEITNEQLEWLGGCAERLRALTNEICNERLASLAKAAEKS